MSATLASANHGYSAKGSRYSLYPTKSHRPSVEMCVTSTEVPFPPGFDFVFMEYDLGLGGLEFGGAQSGIDGKFDAGSQPKLSPTTRREKMPIPIKSPKTRNTARPRRIAPWIDRPSVND